MMLNGEEYQETTDNNWATYTLDNLYSGHFATKDYVEKGSSVTVKADYVGGIVGFAKAIDVNSASSNKYSARDNDYLNTYTPTQPSKHKTLRTVIKLIMTNCFNASDVAHEEIDGKITTQVSVASGMLGSYAGLYGLEFDSCINVGDVYSNSASVGGIISHLEIGRAHV